MQCHLLIQHVLATRKSKTYAIYVHVPTHIMCMCTKAYPLIANSLITPQRSCIIQNHLSKHTLDTTDAASSSISSADMYSRAFSSPWNMYQKHTCDRYSNPMPFCDRLWPTIIPSSLKRPDDLDSAVHSGRHLWEWPLKCFTCLFIRKSLYTALYTWRWTSPASSAGWLLNVIHNLFVISILVDL